MKKSLDYRRRRLQRWFGSPQTGDLNDESFVDEIEHDVESLRKYLEAHDKPRDIEPETEEVPEEPTKIIRIPHERDAASFYGNPKRVSTVWFNFPVDNMRLYNRNGAHLSDHTGDEFDDHKCHPKIKVSLEAAFQEIYDTLGHEQFEKEGWHVYSGCYNYRSKRGGSSLSIHSWGVAIDMNSSENPFRQRTTTFSDRAIDIMEKHGYLSGGRAWGKDWMHFQKCIPYISSGSYYSRHGLPAHIKQF